MKILDPFLPLNVRNDIILDMNAHVSVETCGVIIQAGEEYRYERRENVHPEPEKHFQLSNADAAAVCTDPAIVAYVHSHPVGPLYPSKHDMEIQAEIKKPSVIVARDPKTGVLDMFSLGDHTLDYPLVGRDFRANVTDCFEALRSWVWQCEKFKTKTFPRQDGWWDHLDGDKWVVATGNLYEEHFAEYGYQDIPINVKSSDKSLHPEVGDILLMKMGSSTVANHAAVYVGNNKIYHHRVSHRSGETPLFAAIERHYDYKWLRREK